MTDAWASAATSAAGNTKCVLTDPPITRRLAKSGSDIATPTVKGRFTNFVKRRVSAAPAAGGPAERREPAGTASAGSEESSPTDAGGTFGDAETKKMPTVVNVSCGFP